MSDINKLENASGNLKEILCAIADGKEVQHFSSELCRWLDFYVEPEENIFDTGWLSFEWRIKPDAFECAWSKYYNDFGAPDSTFHAFLHGWNAAIEHKEQSK